jgi:hypothetical protein
MLYLLSPVVDFNGVNRELERLSQQTLEPEPIILFLQTSTAAPAKPIDGMLVRADGVVWNPGAGAGIYERLGGAWVKI